MIRCYKETTEVATTQERFRAYIFMEAHHVLYMLPPPL